MPQIRIWLRFGDRDGVAFAVQMRRINPGATWDDAGARGAAARLFEPQRGTCPNSTCGGVYVAAATEAILREVSQVR